LAATADGNINTSASVTAIDALDDEEVMVKYDDDDDDVVYSVPDDVKDGSDVLANDGVDDERSAISRGW
jgi:hypothetical protein